MKIKQLCAWAVLYAFAASTAAASLPPTTTRGQLDATKTTTFNFTAPAYQITKTDSTTGLIETGSTNILKNPSFEAATFSAGWTKTGAGTWAASTPLGLGAKSLLWSPTGAGETIISTAVTIPDSFKGKSGEVVCSVQVPSGTNNADLAFWNGTSDLGVAVSLSNAPSTGSAELRSSIVFPTSGTIAAKFTSGSSSDPVKIDNCRLGLATNVGSGLIATPWASFTPTTTGLGTLGGTTVQWRRTADSMEIAGNIAVGTTSGTDATMALPNSLSANTSGWGSAARRVGTWIRNISSASSRKTGAIVIFQASPTLLYFTDDDFTTARSPFAALAGSTFISSGETISITIDSPIPIQGWVASDVVMANQQRTPRVVMYTSGSGTYIPSPGVTYIEVYARGGGGGAGGGSSGGTGTAGGSTTFGSLTIGGGFAGSASDGGFPGTVSGTLPSGGSWLQPSLQQGGTGNSGASVTGGNGGGAEYTCPGKGRASNSANGGCVGGGGGAGGGTSSGSVYGGGGGGSGGTAHFLVSAPASSYSFSIGAGGATASAGSSVYGGSDGSAGFIRIVEHFGLTTALLANSVTTGAQNGVNTYDARLTCSSGSGINSASQPGGSIGNISSGNCVVTFPSGMFTSSPFCSLVWESLSTPIVPIVSSQSSAGITVGCFVSNTAGACTNVSGMLRCSAMR